MEIEKLDAQALPYDLRERLLEKCRKRAKPNLAFIIVFVLCMAVFAMTVAKMLSVIAVFGARSLFLGVIILPLIIVSVMVVHTLFIRPKQILKLAEQEDYTCYIGRLTDKKMYTSSRSHGRTSQTYYLYIDDIVKCTCTYEQYKNAEIGDQYAAFYFHHKLPEMCLRVREN